MKLARFKIYNLKEFQRLLRKNGWELERTKGSHYIYKHKDYSDNLAINSSCNKMLCKRLIETYSLYE